MVIFLGNGLDRICFGLNNQEVLQILGIPDKINVNERDGFIIYYYNKIMTKLFFSTEENRLVTIEVFYPETYLFGEKIIGLKMSEIKYLLEKMDMGVYDVEDGDFFESIFCEKIWSIFYFEYDRLKSIEFSVLCNKEGEFVWPETDTVIVSADS